MHQHIKKDFFAAWQACYIYSMEILILGAHTTLGIQLVKQALIKGFEVTAYGRNMFEVALPASENLHVTEGKLFDEAALRKAMHGKDAVLFATGGGTTGGDTTRSTGTRYIVKAMEAAGVNRIVMPGSFGILEDATGKLLMDNEAFDPELLPLQQEFKQAWQTLAAGKLSWTMICPAEIIEALPDADFEVSEKPAGLNMPPVSTGNLAMAMLNELSFKPHVNMRLSIQNI